MKKVDRLKAVNGGLMERTIELYGGGLARAADGSLMLGGVKLTPVGAVLPARMTRGEWADVAKVLALVDDSLAWWLGDLFAYGERSGYGTATELAAELGFKPGTVHQYTWVCRSVEISNRIEDLSFSHHLLVAGMTTVEQRKWLRRAVDEGWSVARMRREIDPSGRGRGLSKQVKSQINGVRQALIEALHEFEEVDNRSMGMMLIQLGERYLDNE